MNATPQAQGNFSEETPADLGRKNFDRKKLADLGRKVIGNRSITDFTKQTGLSRAFVSRLLNEKLVTPPKHNTLFRFAGPDTHPQGGVTVDDLIAVCGSPAQDPQSGSCAPQASSSDSKSTPALTEADIVASYYAPRPTMAMSLFLDTLAERDLSQSYQLSWLPGGAVHIRTDDGQKQALILSAFCTEPTAQQALVFSVLQRILLLICDSHRSQLPIYILTESESMVKRLSEALQPLKSRMRLSILRSSENYLRIVDQKNLPDGAALPFDFTDVIE